MALGLAPLAEGANATALVVACVALSLVYLVYFLDEKPYKGFPVVGLEKNGFFSMAKARGAWIVNGCEILEQGAKKFSGGVFQVITASGPKVILPNRYAHEIRNNPHMSFGKIITKEFFSSYPGFEPFDTLNQHNIIQDATKNKLTQSLTLFTEDISAEVAQILDEILGNNMEDYTTLPLRPLVARVIGQVTSRVLLGPELARNAEWLALVQSYAVTAFAAQQALLSWSPLLRPLVHRFLPACQQLRRLTATGHRVIQPYIDARRDAVRKAEREGREVPRAEDMIGWMEEMARERGVAGGAGGGKGGRGTKGFDIADAQIMLSIAAIHTTAEAYTWVVADLIEHPEYAGPLREEVARVLGPEGPRWQKNSLYRMALHDSFIKESHRRHMVDALVMDRYVSSPVTLSDGLVLPAGTALMVHATNNLSDAHWPAARSFDGHRFVKLRERPGEESRHQLVSTSAEHLGFGLGSQACPGRFFAANTMKLMLAHFVTKYDWKFADEEGKEKQQRSAPFGSSVYVNPMLQVKARRRKEEVSL